MVFYFLHTEIKDQRRKTFSLRSSIFPGEIEKDLKRKLCKLLKKNKNCLHVYCWLDQCDATLKTNPSFGTSITRLRRFPSQPSYRPLKCESSTSHFNTRSPLFLIIVFFIFSNQQPKFVPFFFLQSFEIFNTSDLQRLYLSLLTKKKSNSILLPLSLLCFGLFTWCSVSLSNCLTNICLSNLAESWNLLC